jgi:hypothetical protein
MHLEPYDETCGYTRRSFDTCASAVISTTAPRQFHRYVVYSRINTVAHLQSLRICHEDLHYPCSRHFLLRLGVRAAWADQEQLGQADSARHSVVEAKQQHRTTHSLGIDKQQPCCYLGMSSFVFRVLRSV